MYTIKPFERQQIKSILGYSNKILYYLLEILLPTQSFVDYFP